LFVCELRVYVALAVLMTALGDHIVDIVLMRSEEEMIRVAATAIVAGMEYGRPLRYRTSEDLVCRPMGKPVLHPEREDAVPV